METHRTKCRLFLPTDLGAGGVAETGADQAHYLRSVLRAAVGEFVAVFNGRDGEWLARIETLGKSTAQLSLVQQLRPQSRSQDITLCFAPIKKSALDFLVVKATELGVGRLVPVFTERTDVTRVNLDRLTANVREAAEQCERLDIPTVDDPLGLEQLVARWPHDNPLMVCAERRSAGSLQSVAATLGQPAAILIGPEGGFAERELDLLAKLPFVHPVHLGPRILRAETAAVAALACWQAAVGDFR